jgi:phosphatidate cytidylyltransferase
VVYLGGWWFVAAISLACTLAGYEFVSLMRRAGYSPSLPLCWLLIALLTLDALFPAWQVYRWLLPLWIMGSLTWQLFQRATRTPVIDWALALACGLYMGLVVSHAIMLRNGPSGRLWMGLVLLTTWATDTAAYLIGLTWGRHRLWPRLSPGKTWEGAIGGWLTGVVVTALLTAGIGAGWVHGLALGVIVASAAPFGDLSISMIKRQVGVKDSGNLIPGHGGVLDRLDSMFFIILAVHFYVTTFIGP